MLGNPAGLTTIDNLQIMASGRSFLGIDEGYNKEGGSYSPETTTESLIDNKFYNAAIAFPIKTDNNKKIVGVIGYRSYYDISFKTSTTSEQTEFSNQRHRTLEYDGLLNVVTIGTGIQLDEKVKIGLLYNVPVNTKYKMVSEDIYQYIRLVGNNKILKTADVSGSNFFQLGVQIRPMRRLTIGAIYIMEHSVEQKSRVEIGNHIKAILDDKILEFPYFWSVGVQYQLPSKLILTVEMQNFSWDDYLVRTYYETGNSYHIGAEYEKILKWRLGYSTTRLPFDDSKNKPFDTYGITGGAGYTFKDLSFNLSALYRIIKSEGNEYSQYGYAVIDYGEYHYYNHDLLVYASCIYNFDF